MVSEGGSDSVSVSLISEDEDSEGGGGGISLDRVIVVVRTCVAKSPFLFFFPGTGDKITD